MENKKITLVLPLDEMEALLNMLADDGFKKKSKMIAEIQTQANNQIQPLQTVPEPVDMAKIRNDRSAAKQEEKK